MALADGRVESFEQPHYAAWIIEREAGGFVAGIGRDIVRIDLDADVREAIVSVDPRNAGNRLNDAKADARGRIWAGTMPVTCDRSEEHTSELQSLMRTTYAVFCLTKKNKELQ